MRKASHVAALALAVTACTSENELRFVSTLDATTYGVALSEDGNNSHVGMSGMTCTVSTEWGCPVDDADLPTEEERVLDHFEGLTLASSTGAVHQIDADGWRRTDDIEVDGVRAARYTNQGLLMIRGDSEACFVQSDSTQTSVPGALCDTDVKVQVDRDAGVLYAATGKAVYTVDEEGADKIEQSDLVAWDRRLEQRYTATNGESTLHATTRDGNEVWTTDLDLPIRSLSARGNKGQVLVLTDSSDGFGLLHRLDGETGRPLSSSELPDSAGEIEVSGNGHAVAIIRDEEVHFFSLVIDREGESEVVEENPPSCLQDDRISAD
jgi:hypothetical protein